MDRVTSPLQVARAWHSGPTGEAGGNSAFRRAAVRGRLETLTQFARPRPPAVLLVYDQAEADSRWTMTVAARELRLAGADAVLPFVLALVA